MKRKLFAIAIILFILTGCNSISNSEPGSKEQGGTSVNTNNETEPKTVENDVNESQEVGQNNKEDKDIKSTEKSDSGKDGTDKNVELEPKYKLNSKNWRVEPIDSASEKVVLLTIDDAPDKYALEMAQTLKSLDVKAIFFVNGHFIDSKEEKEVLKKIYNLGFPIGNHTWNHKKLSDLSEKEQLNEIIELNNEIESITGERPKFFRAPHGINTDYSKKVVADEGMLLMNWSYGYDWEKEYMTKDAISDIMVNTPYLSDGANLLMHDRKWTSEALKDIVIGLQEKGYGIVDPALIQTPK